MKKFIPLLIAVAIFAAGCATSQVPQFATRRITPPTVNLDNATNVATNNYLRHNDPSLVTLFNSGEAFKRVTITPDPKWGESPKKELEMEPGKRIAFRFPPGKHRISVLTRRATAAHGIWDTGRKFEINVRLDSYPQIFYLYD